MGCGGSAQRVAPLIEAAEETSEKESAGGDVILSLLKSAPKPTTGGTGDGEERLILLKSVEEETQRAPGDSAARPATPSTNGGEAEGEGAADEELETASNAPSTEGGGGMVSPTKKRGNGNGNGNQALLPEEDPVTKTPLAQDAAAATLAAEGFGGSSAVPEPEKGDAAEQAKPAGPAPSSSPLEALDAAGAAAEQEKPAAPVREKDKETEKEKEKEKKEKEKKEKKEKEKPSPSEEDQDPATAKLVLKLEKLEADLAGQRVTTAGAMQKRAWRNKRRELVECFDEACAAASPERKSALQERLEKLGVQLDGKEPQTAPKPSTHGPAGVVAG